MDYGHRVPVEDTPVDSHGDTRVDFACLRPSCPMDHCRIGTWTWSLASCRVLAVDLYYTTLGQDLIASARTSFRVMCHVSEVRETPLHHTQIVPSSCCRCLVAEAS